MIYTLTGFVRELTKYVFAQIISLNLSACTV
jgi:hypothetical protein